MPYAFFLESPCSPEPGAANVLNDFLRTHSILAVQKEWVSAADSSFWAFCIQYQEAGAAQADAGGGRGSIGGKVDYKEVLSTGQFEGFARLRVLRKTLAERDGVPVFTVFTNEQLAEMVRLPVRSLAELKGISGIGDARAEKYGQEVLVELARLPAANIPPEHEKREGSV